MIRLSNHAIERIRIGDAHGKRTLLTPEEVLNLLKHDCVFNLRYIHRPSSPIYKIVEDWLLMYDLKFDKYICLLQKVHAGYATIVTVLRLEQFEIGRDHVREDLKEALKEITIALPVSYT